jgi:hypothetical protein
VRCKEKEREERAKERKEEGGWKEMPGMQKRTNRIKKGKYIALGLGDTDKMH